MPGLGQIFNDRSPLYLCVGGYVERPVGGPFSEVLYGVVVGSRRGCFAAGLGAALLQGLSVLVPLCVCRCVCGMQCGGRVGPPHSVLQIAA